MTVTEVRGPVAAEVADGIDVWNLHDGVVAVTGGQERFVVVGTVSDAPRVEALTYRLNGGPERAVVLRRSAQVPQPTRLTRVGDFSIDTIAPQELRGENELTICAYQAGHSRSRTIAFRTTPLPGTGLDVARSRYAEETAQVVDGRWVRTVDDLGRPCLRITPGDAGLDRVMLFTGPVHAPAYDVLMRVRVDRWIRDLHNLGIVFAWRGHDPGDGMVLPSTWTTGLGYYYSRGAGLRLRVGERVRYDADGRKIGDTLLGEAPLSRRRAVVARASRRLTHGTALRQLPTGRDLWFRLQIRAESYRLTVWSAGHPEPTPQVTAPPAAHAPGAAGIIAHYCAVSVYEARVEVGAQR